VEWDAAELDCTATELEEAATALEEAATELEEATASTAELDLEAVELELERATLVALYADATEAGDVWAFQLPPVGTTVFWPLLWPLNPRSLLLREPSELTMLL